MRRVIYAALATAVIALAEGWMYSAANTERAIATHAAGEGKYFMRCPNSVKVGIKGPPTGWNAEPDQYHPFIEAAVVRQGGITFINCDYGTAGIKNHALTHIATAGYDCRLVAAGQKDAVCTPKPKAPVKIK